MALAAAVVAAVVVLSVLKRPKVPECTLPDGSVLRVEKISFGKRESFRPGGRMRIVKDWVMDWLAKEWPGRFRAPARNISSWWNNSTVHTNTDALQIWVTRRDPVNGKYLDVSGFGGGFRTAQLMDEHGCAFMATQAGGNEDGLLGPNGGGGYSVGWFTFEAFPRHEKSFRLKLSGNRLLKTDAEFTIPNPAPPPHMADWTTEPLPITKRDGDMAFTLTGIKIETNYVERIAPEFEEMERGQLTKEWQAVDLELYDGSGNFGSKLNSQGGFLCPWESVWKLVVRFCGSEQSASASNSVWKISGVKVPGEGEFVALNATNQVQGVTMKVMALTGAGNVTYSNGVVAQASPFGGGDQRANTESTSTWGTTNYTVNLSSITPHVALEIGALSENERLTLRAIDDQGRQTYAQEWGYYQQVTGPKETHYLSSLNTSQPNILILDLPNDAKTVDLIFCIHNARVEEFFFKPPMPEKQQRK